MSNSSDATGPSRSNRAIILVVLLGVIGAGAYWGLRGTTTPGPEALEQVVLESTTPADPAPEAETEEAVLSDETPAPAADTTPQDTAEQAIEPTPVPPSFDEVRQEADGLTVIAGRAEPGSTVTVLVDGVEAATATADARGSFAAVGILNAGTSGSVVTLRQDAGDTSTVSAEEIILAPVAAQPDVSVADASQDTATEIASAPAASQDTGAEETAAQEAPTANEVEAEAVAALTPTPAPATPNQTAPQSEQPEGPVAALEVSELGDEPTVQDAPSVPQATPAPPTPARSAVAVLKSSQGGVELLQAPPVIETVALDTIGYSDSGEVQLSGRAQADAAEVRVYLNNDVVAQLAVDADGRWRGDVPDVAPGIYTLRVDEVNAAGAVTSRVETPFKREAPAVLAEAAADVDGPVRAITVQRGDTLWAIARDRYGEGPLYVRVFDANRSAIRDPDLIYPGQVFDLPD